MESEIETNELDKVFAQIKTRLPADWLENTEELRLHLLLEAINYVLKPSGSWVLVNGDMTLLQLINEKSI